MKNVIAGSDLYWHFIGLEFKKDPAPKRQLCLCYVKKWGDFSYLNRTQIEHFNTDK